MDNAQHSNFKKIDLETQKTPEPSNFGNDSTENITQFTVPQRNTFTQEDLDLFYKKMPDSFRKKTMDFRYIDEFVDKEILGARLRIAETIHRRIRTYNILQIYKRAGIMLYEAATCSSWQKFNI